MPGAHDADLGGSHDGHRSTMPGAAGRRELADRAGVAAAAQVVTATVISATKSSARAPAAALPSRAIGHVSLRWVRTARS